MFDRVILVAIVIAMDHRVALDYAHAFRLRLAEN
jgi:hypothetical protein